MIKDSSLFNEDKTQTRKKWAEINYDANNFKVEKSRLLHNANTI